MPEKGIGYRVHRKDGEGSRGSYGTSPEQPALTFEEAECYRTAADQPDLLETRPIEGEVWIRTPEEAQINLERMRDYWHRGN